MFADSDQVAVGFELLRELDWTGCMAGVFDDVMQAGFEAERLDMAVTRYSATETSVSIGDEGIGLRIAMTVESQGEQAESVFDFSVVGAVSAFSQISLDGAIDDLDALVSDH